MWVLWAFVKHSFNQGGSFHTFIQSCCHSFYDYMWSFWVEANLQVFLVCLLICIVVEVPITREEGFDPINQFHPATFLCLSRPGPRFPTLNGVFFFVLNCLRCEVDIHFVDIADHHSCLLILLTITVVCWYCWPSRLFVDTADHHGCLLILLTITVVCWYCWPSWLFVDTADHHSCLLILLTITWFKLSFHIQSK